MEVGGYLLALERAQRAYVAVAASTSGIDGAEVPRSSREIYIALHRVYRMAPLTTAGQGSRPISAPSHGHTINDKPVRRRRPPPPPPPPQPVHTSNTGSRLPRVVAAAPGSLTASRAGQLGWRNRHCGAAEFQLEVLPELPPVRVAQLMAGEEKQIGTGTTVWDASTVLVRYLQRCAVDLRGKRLVDLGSGTGITGFAAAALGARVTVTDQSQILFLLEQNLATNVQSGAVPAGSVSISEFSWGDDAAHLAPPLDYVLACECIVPRLYPIEPLVAAIDSLSGPSTVTYVVRAFMRYAAVLLVACLSDSLHRLDYFLVATGI